MADLSFVRKFPNECCEDVTRRGISQPCDKPAVAARIDPQDGDAYPVCSRHARAKMIPLVTLLADAWEAGHTAGRDAGDPAVHINPYTGLVYKH